MGGASGPLGGLEVFRDRSATAIVTTHPDWRVDRLPTDTAYLNFRRLPRTLGWLLKLVRLSFERPDFVWLHYVNLPDLAFLGLARLLGLRVMVTPHLGLNWRSQQQPLLRRISHWLLRSSKRMAMLSRTQEEELALPAEVPKSYIRHFLPQSMLVAEPSDRKAATLQLIHASRLSEGKGTFLFIEVCKRLLDNGVPFHARISGKAVDKDTEICLMKMIADYKLSPHIDFLGWLPTDELVSVLRQSDVLIHLSSIDSYPLIVLEAMSCSVVPLCLSLAGAVDMVKTYGGHLVDADHSVDEAVAFLQGQTLEDIRAIGRAGAARIHADYAWPKVTEALNEAFQLMVK